MSSALNRWARRDAKRRRLDPNYAAGVSPKPGSCRECGVAVDPGHQQCSRCRARAKALPEPQAFSPADVQVVQYRGPKTTRVKTADGRVYLTSTPYADVVAAIAKAAEADGFSSLALVELDGPDTVRVERFTREQDAGRALDASWAGFDLAAARRRFAHRVK